MILFRFLGLVIMFVYFSLGSGEEHICSRYHYEEQTLSKAVRLEHRLDILEDKVINKTAKLAQNPTCAQCPDMWMPFKKFCYLFVDEQHTFEDARHHCMLNDGYLVEIESETENVFLKNQLKKMKEVHYWIGLTDVDKEGTFKWLSSDDDASFTDWGPDRPNNSGGNQDCVLFHHGLAFKWDDYDCGAKYKSICEKKAE